MSIVATLKVFETILLGYEIEIHTEHKNLVYKTLLISSDHVIHWWILIEEYGPQILYITGPNTVVVDVLSKITTMDKVPHNIMYKKMYRTIMHIHKT